MNDLLTNLVEFLDSDLDAESVVDQMLMLLEDVSGCEDVTELSDDEVKFLLNLYYSR